MSLTSNDPVEIEKFVGEQTTQPPLFPSFTVANKPTLARLKYRAIYITDTAKPAWMDVNGVWRYADGTTV